MNLIISNTLAAKAAKIHMTRFFLLGQSASMEGYARGAPHLISQGRRLDAIGMMFNEIARKLEANQPRMCIDPKHELPCPYDNCNACQTECVKQ